VNSPLDRHTRIALSFSGGKDSLACVQLLKDRLDDITIYHLDTGDLLPEMRASVAAVESFAPHFVRVETDVAGWISQHGLPSDLVPYSSHAVGLLMGETTTPLVGRYECCYANLMWPLFERVMQDGMTLLIRGTKSVDMARLPAASGEVVGGVELYYPLLDWTHEQVFAYLAREGVKLPRIYNYTTNSPECARCSAWWGEGRAAYLKKYHPELWAEYDARLQVVINAIAPSLALLRQEAGVT
jgi:phosphoadenosine phosphosulfate reductase